MPTAVARTPLALRLNGLPNGPRLHAAGWQLGRVWHHSSCMPYGRGRTPLALRLNSFAQRAACFTPPAGSW